jgi:predicted dehydrogenase
MRIGFRGELRDEPVVKAGFIGCGSHSYRNIYPTFHYAPVQLQAVCDLDMAKAEAFAAKLGAAAAYSDYRRMLAAEDLDAVFICTGYDANGRPLYPPLAVDCLNAGRHVWMEKPPAATTAEIRQMQEAAAANGKNVVVGMKKMFFPANEMAYELMHASSFGTPQLVMIQYPQYIPTVDEFRQYSAGERVNAVVGFLDHLCHPMSLLLYLMGMPETLHYQRSERGAGMATFRYGSGAVASIAFTCGASINGGMERTTIVSDRGQHITVENNVRVTLHRMARTGYGDMPSFYIGTPEQAAAVWEPEFSLGQLYNKGLFLLGYYGEVNEFACSILEGRSPAKGTLEQAWQATRVFEAFAEGPGCEIDLREGSA